jgi:hypothetical protein
MHGMHGLEIDLCTDKVELHVIIMQMELLLKCQSCRSATSGFDYKTLYVIYLCVQIILQLPQRGFGMEVP